jgi:hypothetical protein
MPDLSDISEISVETVAHVIYRSRERSLNGADWADGFQQEGASEAEAGAAPVDPADDPARRDLWEYLNLLSKNEQASLVALAWIGRGTYAPGEIAEAISAAKAAHSANAPAYLFNLPLLPDYLEDALEQLGYAPM